MRIFFLLKVLKSIDTDCLSLRTACVRFNIRSESVVINWRKGLQIETAAENFFGILKSELFYLKKYDSVLQLKQDIIEYVKYYNNDRIKLNLME